MTRILFLSACIFYTAANAQELQLMFARHSKMTRTTNNRISYATDGKRIFVRDLTGYQMFSFDTQEWSRLRLPVKLSNEAGPSSAFIPEMNMVITIGSSIETIQVDNLQFSHPVKINGIYPSYCGSDVYKGKVYLIGGVQVRPGPSGGMDITDNVYSVDPNTLEFKPEFRLPEPNVTKGKFMNGFLYIFGGTDGRDNFSEILLFDPDNVQFGWKRIGSLPHPVANYSLATDDKRFYLMGGENGQGYFGIYDPATFEYKEYATNLNITDGGLVVHENKVYFFGGQSMEYPYALSNLMYVFDLGLVKGR